jgi:hypothetical protein
MNGAWVSKNLPTADTYIAGFAYKQRGTSDSMSDTQIFAFRDGSTEQVCLLVDTSKTSIYLTAGGTTRWTQSIKHGDWHYIEIKTTIHNSTGSLYLKWDGEAVLSLTGIDTQVSGTAQITNFLLGGTGGSYRTPNCAFDDLYVCDTSGSNNNDFLGDVRVQSIFPTGAGNTTQWTPSAGNNYACVDDTTPNADTDYVSETTTGEKDTYAFGNVTPTSGTVKGVQVLIHNRKDDAGSRTIAPVYRPVSTDYDGTAVAVLDGYTYIREITEVSPATSAAWTIAEINGAEFGVKLVS